MRICSPKITLITQEGTLFEVGKIDVHVDIYSLPGDGLLFHSSFKMYFMINNTSLQNNHLTST